jgi:hypothetical protein
VTCAPASGLVSVCGEFAPCSFGAKEVDCGTAIGAAECRPSSPLSGSSVKRAVSDGSSLSPGAISVWLSKSSIQGITGATGVFDPYPFPGVTVIHLSIGAGVSRPYDRMISAVFTRIMSRGSR